MARASFTEAKRISSLQNLEQAKAANAARFQFGVWRCATCGKEAAATVHQLRKMYCSKNCMAAGYRVRMVGAENPNHRDAGLHVCSACGTEYRSYQKDQKFCSHACYVQSKPKKHPRQLQLKLVKPAPVKKERRQKSEKACIHCGRTYKACPSESGRLYCSYACHLASGGAFRAGLAAKAATMKYGPKKDANHNEVFDEMRKHCAVYDFSTMGCGLPDGIAWVTSQWHLFDVKNPKTGYGRRGLNTVQKKWLAQWNGGPVYLIHSIEEAARFGRGEMEGIKFITPEQAREELAQRQAA